MRAAVAQLPFFALGVPGRPATQLRVQLDVAAKSALCTVAGSPGKCQPTPTGVRLASAQPPPPAAGRRHHLPPARPGPPAVLKGLAESLGEAGCPGGVGYVQPLDSQAYSTFDGQADSRSPARRRARRAAPS